MNRLNMTRIGLTGAALLSAAFLVGYVAIWQWTVCRVEVGPGQSLLLRYKGPFPFGKAEQAPEGALAARR